MLLVQIDRFLDGIVANHVAVCQVLCNDTGSGLLFLGDLIAITLSV
jgi:hypothetical protein